MKFVALAFLCLLFFSMPANANEAGTFNAMVALANKGDAEAQYHGGLCTDPEVVLLPRP